MTKPSTFPRDLTAEERALLDLILSEEWDGVEPVREALRTTQVVGGCDCGCGSFDLGYAEGGRPNTDWNTAPVEGRGEVDGVYFEVLLHLWHEAHAELEVAWYGDNPGRLPTLAEVKVATSDPPTFAKGDRVTVLTTPADYPGRIDGARGKVIGHTERSQPEAIVLLLDEPSEVVYVLEADLSPLSDAT